MKNLIAILTFAALLAVVSVPVIAGGQVEAKAMSGAELRTMIVNLGFTVKDLNTEVGKEKVEFMQAKGGYNVWIGAEVSPSKRYIWLTSFLGPVSDLADFNDRAPKILLANSKIQPCFFYTTEKGSFMVAIAVDNRNIDPATLRFRIDKLAQDVADNAEVWKK